MKKLFLLLFLGFSTFSSYAYDTDDLTSEDDQENYCTLTIQAQRALIKTLESKVSEQDFLITQLQEQLGRFSEGRVPFPDRVQFKEEMLKSQRIITVRIDKKYSKTKKEKSLL